MKKLKKAGLNTPKPQYQITECFNVLKNLWAQPEYTELVITNRAWYKLIAFINLIGDYEISGFGRVQTIPDTTGKLVNYVTDFDIIRQEVKEAYVEADADAVAEFILSLKPEERNEWTLDWHSHVNMGTSPSGTDWDNYAEMLRLRLGNQFPSMIVNKQGNITAQQIISDNRHTDIKVYVTTKELPETELVAIYKECKEKVQKLCTLAPKTTTYTNKQWAHNYGFEGQRYTDYWEDADTDCVYCGNVSDKKCSDEIGFSICKECFDTYAHTSSTTKKEKNYGF
jgi:hypothetical protein